MECFAPSRDLSIDEAMIRFDGRLAWKQYMPKKPVKWGMKLWCLCDANTGYCLEFSLYTGSSEIAGANLGISCCDVLDASSLAQLSSPIR